VASDLVSMKRLLKGTGEKPDGAKLETGGGKGHVRDLRP